MAWAEDKAPWRHDLSADPGTKTEGREARWRRAFPFRDWYESGKSSCKDQAFANLSFEPGFSISR